VGGPASRITEPSKSVSVPISDIPTDNPDAALRFCQALAGQVDSGSVVSCDQARAHVDYAFTSSASAQAPELSVVIPVYNEEENLPVLYEPLVKVLENQKLDFEIVFVDDGSCDYGVQMLKEMENSRVVVIELARNFGFKSPSRRNWISRAESGRTKYGRNSASQKMRDNNLETPKAKTANKDIPVRCAKSQDFGFRVDLSIAGCAFQSERHSVLLFSINSSACAKEIEGSSALHERDLLSIRFLKQRKLTIHFMSQHGWDIVYLKSE
jgi:hypothetical protein